MLLGRQVGAPAVWAPPGRAGTGTWLMGRSDSCDAIFVEAEGAQEFLFSPSVSLCPWLLFVPGMRHSFSRDETLVFQEQLGKTTSEQGGQIHRLPFKGTSSVRREERHSPPRISWSSRELKCVPPVSPHHAAPPPPTSVNI